MLILQVLVKQDTIVLVVHIFLLKMLWTQDITHLQENQYKHSVQ